MSDETAVMEAIEAIEAQPFLVPEIKLWPRAEQPQAEDGAPARVKAVLRNQRVMRVLDVERLLDADHPARAIWELVGQCDLQPFHREIKAVKGKAGRPSHDPRLLISLWVYSYTQGIASGREIEERCGYDPAYIWMAGAEKVCAHSLTDFRAERGEALKDLSSQILAAMAGEGLVDLQQVTQDGTKINASAGSDTLRRQGTIEKRVEEARQRVEQLSKQEEKESKSRRSAAAQRRAAKEQLERLEKALEAVKELQKKGKTAEEARVSITDPDARVMKQNNNGYGLSYNAQFTTDARNTVIVSVAVTRDGNDAGQLEPAIDRLQEEAGRQPEQALADGGYASRENIVKMEQKGVDLIAPVPDGKVQKETLYQIRGVTAEFRPEAFAFDGEKNCYTCPAGKSLPYRRKNVEPGRTKYIYQAAKEDCRSCASREQCCRQSRNGRSVQRVEESEEVKSFRTKMETEEAKAIYRKRGTVAEFPHLWIKEKFGLRRFSLRGLKKVNVEGMWVAITFNLQQWIRLSWKQRLGQTA
jgi:transposase